MQWWMPGGRRRHEGPPGQPLPSPGLITGLTCTGVVQAMRFAPDGRLLATADDNKSVILWDVSDPADSTQTATLAAHSAAVKAVGFRSDGRLLASGGDDKSVVLWDVTDPAHPARTVTLHHRSKVNALAFAPDGLLAIGSDDASVILWDVADPAGPTRTATLHHREAVTAVGFNPNGRLLVTGCRGDDRNTAIMWDVADPAYPARIATLLPHWKGRFDSGFTSTHPTMHAVEFSPDGRSVVTGSEDHGIVSGTVAPWNEGAVVLWDVTDPARPAQAATPILGRSLRAQSVTAVAFSPDGQSLATASDKTLTLWDVAQPTRPVRIASVTSHSRKVSAVSFSPDGHTLATASYDMSVRLWDAGRPSRSNGFNTF